MSKKNIGLVVFLFLVVFPAILLAYDPKDFHGAEPLAPMTFTPCVNGMAGIYPCHNIDLLSFVPLASMGCSGASDIWGWTDPLTNKEYAMLGCTNRTAFVDISDPVNPIFVGYLPSHTGTSSWRELKAYANHAFIISDINGNHGLQILDMTQFRTVTNPPVQFSETAFYNGFGSAHDITVNPDTGYLYVVGGSSGTNTCSGGPHMLNIQNPTSPVFVGCVNQDGYTHDTQVVIYHGPDAAFTGHELLFSSNEDTLTIVDVTNKANPIQVSRTGYTGSGYTHQGWLTEDHHYFLLDDELDEEDFGHNTFTYIWDVSDLNAPVLMGHYTGPVPSIDHNLFIKGQYAYEGNYRSGLRILDVTNVASAQLTELAFFDIYPSSDGVGFNGMWGNYPFFNSGVVIASGIEQGLFVLQPTLNPDFGVSATDTNLYVCSSGSAATDINVTPIQGYNGNVTLSTSTLPAGMTAGFSVNPVTVPGSSTMTLNLSSTPPGDYSIDVVASDATLTHSTPVALNVALTTPSAPSLVTPADGSTDQQLILTFEWNAAALASNYTFELSDDAAFTNIVYTVTLSTTSHTANINLTPSTTYYWRVAAFNACGSTLSSVFQFTTRPPSGVLLVDDDDNNPDVRSYYANLLSTLGIQYDVFDVANDQDQGRPDHILVPRHLPEPRLAQLQIYPVVLWFSGGESGGSLDPHAGPTEASETFLSQYLDGGGCLVLSSQDYFKDRGSVANPFMLNYLGLNTVSGDRHYTTVTGAGSVFSGIGPLSLTFPFTNTADRIYPGTGAETAFTYFAPAAAGINKDGGIYRTIYLGFPLETVDSTNGPLVLQRALDYCNHTVDCPTITVDPATLSDGALQIAYSQTLSASGGTGPYTFVVNSGNLPPGVALSSDGILSGTPTTEGTFSFTVTATDVNGCTGTHDYSLTINAGCLYCDDFEDGVLSPSWTYIKPNWTETGGLLQGIPQGRKAMAIATSAFGGCRLCTMTTHVQITGGQGNRVWLHGWYVDDKNGIELLIKQERDTWILKQRANGSIVKKTKVTSPVAINTSYRVDIAFDGTQFTVSVDGSLLMTLTPAAPVPSGVIGFEVKNTTASFEDIIVN